MGEAIYSYVNRGGVLESIILNVWFCRLELFSSQPLRLKQLKRVSSMDMHESSQLVEDCEERSDRMSDWECTFVDSLKGQLVDGRRLTDKQAEVLEKIWEAVTEKG